MAGLLSATDSHRPCGARVWRKRGVARQPGQSRFGRAGNRPRAVVPVASAGAGSRICWSSLAVSEPIHSSAMRPSATRWNSWLTYVTARPVDRSPRYSRRAPCMVVPCSATRRSGLRQARGIACFCSQHRNWLRGPVARWGSSLRGGTSPLPGVKSDLRQKVPRESQVW